jgi:proteic killer suppression protein
MSASLTFSSSSPLHYSTELENAQSPKATGPYCLTFNVYQYTLRIVIQSFRCPDTERLFRREPVRRFKAIERPALRKLAMLDAAESLAALRVPPGNRLERLAGDRDGQFSIRVNDQWRICFEWRDAHAYEVEIMDYH